MKINSKTKYCNNYITDPDKYKISERVRVLPIQEIIDKRNSDDVQVIVKNNVIYMLSKNDPESYTLPQETHICGLTFYNNHYSDKICRIISIEDDGDCLPIQIETEDGRYLRWIHQIFLDKI